MDQEAQVERLRELARDYKGTIYSFDLTAATDRLPIKLQTDLLSLLFNRTFAVL